MVVGTTSPSSAWGSDCIEMPDASVVRNLQPSRAIGLGVSLMMWMTPLLATRTLAMCTSCGALVAFVEPTASKRVVSRPIWGRMGWLLFISLSVYGAD